MDPVMLLRVGGGGSFWTCDKSFILTEEEEEELAVEKKKSVFSFMREVDSAVISISNNPDDFQRAPRVPPDWSRSPDKFVSLE